MTVRTTREVLDLYNDAFRFTIQGFWMIWSQTIASSRTRARLRTGHAVRAVKRAWRGGQSSRGTVR